MGIRTFWDRPPPPKEGRVLLRSRVSAIQPTWIFGQVGKWPAACVTTPQQQGKLRGGLYARSRQLALGNEHALSTPGNGEILKCQELVCLEIGIGQGNSSGNRIHFGDSKKLAGFQGAGRCNSVSPASHFAKPTDSGMEEGFTHKRMSPKRCYVF